MWDPPCGIGCYESPDVGAVIKLWFSIGAASALNLQFISLAPTYKFLTLEEFEVHALCLDVCGPSIN